MENRKRKANLLLALILTGALAAWAQEGHPLVGSWHGDWGTEAKSRNPVTLAFEYDGKNITGVMNPGKDSAKLAKATLDPANWSVHFEADTKDRAGAAVHVIVDGKIENLSSPARSIVGIWEQGGIKGDFRVKRDN